MIMIITVKIPRLKQHYHVTAGTLHTNIHKPL